MDKGKPKKGAPKNRKRIDDSLRGNMSAGERKFYRRGGGRMMNEFRAGQVS